MATLTVNLRSQNEASDEIEGLRRRIASINAEIAENRRRIEQADEATRASLRTRNQQLSLERGVLRASKESTSIRLSGLKAEGRALRALVTEERRAAAERARVARQQESQLRRIGQEYQNLARQATVAAGVATYAFGRFTSGLITSAAQLETYAATLRIVEPTAEDAATALDLLLQKTVELVGIDTSDLLRFYSNFRQAGLDQQEAIRSVEGVTRAIAEQGKTYDITNRILVQFRQALSQNRIEQRDLNIILSEVPHFYRVASEALGEHIKGVDDLRDATDRVGGITRGFTIILQHLADTSRGADLNTFNAQMEIFRDNVTVLQAEIGQELLPTVIEFVKYINEIVQRFRDADPRWKEFIAFSAVAATGLSALTVVIGGTTVALGALNASITTITGSGGLALLSRLGGSAGGVLRFLGSNAGIATTGLVTVAQAWNQIYRDFQRTAPFENATDQVKALDIATSETARAFRITADLIKNQSAEVGQEISLTVSRMDELRQEIIILSNAAGNNQQALASLRAEYRQLSEALTRLKTDAQEANAAVSTPPTNPFRDIIEAENRLRGFRDLLGSANNAENLDIFLRSAVRAAEDERRLREQIARQTIEDTQQLGAELYRIEVDSNREVESLYRTHADRISAIQQQQLESRIDAARRARDVDILLSEQAATAGQDYANQLRELATPELRRRFVDLVASFQAQGLSLAEARSRAAEYIPFLNTLQEDVTGADAAYGQFTSTLQANAIATEDSITGLRGLVNAVRDVREVIRASSESETLRLLLPERGADQREQDYFDNLPQGRDLEALRQETGEAGREFVDQFNRDSIRATRQAVSEQYSEYERFYRRLSRLAVDSISGRFDSFQEFLGQLTRQLATYLASYAVSKLKEVAIDNAVTAAKIANQKRLQAEIATTQTASITSSATGFLGLGPVGLALGALGVGASLVALFNSVNGASERNRNIIRGATPNNQNINVSLQPSSKFAREQSYVVDNLNRSNRR